MTVDRMTRVNELLKREIGQALVHIMNKSEFDHSIVTVTGVNASRNLREARVGVSIRDHHDQRKRILSYLRKNRAEMQHKINSNLALKYTPRLSFELDESLEKGDKMLSLLSELEAEPEQPPDNSLERVDNEQQD